MSDKIKKILLKKDKDKIVSLTAYSKSFAKILDKHCDIILVGDSMANVLYGLNSTDEITLTNIIEHGSSVRKGVKNSLLVIDMPNGSYNNQKQAKKNAKLNVIIDKADKKYSSEVKKKSFPSKKNFLYGKRTK